MSDWKAWRMVQAFGSLVCGLTRRHKWGKPVSVDNDPAGDPIWVKRCKRCSVIRPVKRRVRK